MVGFGVQVRQPVTLPRPKCTKDLKTVLFDGRLPSPAAPLPAFPGWPDLACRPLAAIPKQTLAQGTARALLPFLGALLGVQGLC